MFKYLTSGCVFASLLVLTGCNDDDNGGKKFYFPKNAIEVTYGETADLNLNYTSAKLPTYESDNEYAVSVDNWGTVTGELAGTAKITATSYDGQQTDTCIVTVVPTTSVFADPYLPFGVTSKKILKYEDRELIYMDTTLMFFAGENQYIDEVYYLFDDAKRYEMCYFFLPNTSSVDFKVSEHLTQRFYYAGKDTDGTQVFYNQDAIVGKWVDETYNEIVLAFIPMEENTGASGVSALASPTLRASKGKLNVVKETMDTVVKPGSSKSR
ncbi:MAG: Ig-like domain-containing protein [Breznakibacter sp.]